MVEISPIHPRRIRTAERRRQALELRKHGLTFGAIGTRLGITRQAAFKMVKRELNRLADETQAEARQWRALEAMRLDQLQSQLALKAMKGDVKAILATLKVMERRAKLYGLDMPAKHALGNPEGKDLIEGEGLANLLKAAGARADS